jgi:hypothetical protein
MAYQKGGCVLSRCLPLATGIRNHGWLKQLNHARVRRRTQSRKVSALRCHSQSGHSRRLGLLTPTPRISVRLKEGRDSCRRWVKERKQKWPGDC